MSCHFQAQGLLEVWWEWNGYKAVNYFIQHHKSRISPPLFNFMEIVLIAHPGHSPHLAKFKI